MSILTVSTFNSLDDLHTEPNYDGTEYFWRNLSGGAFKHYLADKAKKAKKAEKALKAEKAKNC